MMRKEKADQAKYSGSEKSGTPPKVVKKQPSASLLKTAMDNPVVALALLAACMLISTIFVYARNIRSGNKSLPSEAHAPGTPLLGNLKVSMDGYGYHVGIDHNGKHVCSGNIISENYVLTVARCVENRAWNDLTVVSGTERIDTGGTVHKVVEVILPEDPEADIALVQVTPPIVEDGKRESVELADAMQKRMPVGHLAFITGWGRGEHLEVSIEPLADIEVCKKAYGPRHGMGLSLFCAGVMSDDNRHGACPRERGSGLIVHGFLTGIFSEGKECGTSRYPGIYVDIAYYRMWIKDRSGV